MIEFHDSPQDMRTRVWKAMGKVSKLAWSFSPSPDDRLMSPNRLIARTENMKKKRTRMAPIFPREGMAYQSVSISVFSPFKLLTRRNMRAMRNTRRTRKKEGLKPRSPEVCMPVMMVWTIERLTMKKSNTFHESFKYKRIPKAAILKTASMRKTAL